VFTEAGRTERENEAHAFVTRLTNWRKNKAVIHHGALTQFVPEDNTYVYFRHDDAETVMVVLNAADAPRTLALDRFTERIQGYTQGRDVVAGTTIALDDTLTVPAKTPLILELRR
jgi:glycosidase